MARQTQRSSTRNSPSPALAAGTALPVRRAQWPEAVDTDWWGMSGRSVDPPGVAQIGQDRRDDIRIIGHVAVTRPEAAI